MGSVYCTPLASSASDASFRFAAIDARILASSSARFSASLFAASVRVHWDSIDGESSSQ